MDKHGPVEGDAGLAFRVKEVDRMEGVEVCCQQGSATEPSCIGSEQRQRAQRHRAQRHRAQRHRAQWERVGGARNAVAEKEKGEGGSTPAHRNCVCRQWFAYLAAPAGDRRARSYHDGFGASCPSHLACACPESRRGLRTAARSWPGVQQEGSRVGVDVRRTRRQPKRRRLHRARQQHISVRRACGLNGLAPVADR